MTIPKTIAAATVLAALVVTVFAQSQTTSAAPVPAPSQPVSANEVFSRWDKDHNGALSKEEFKVGWDQVQATLLVFKLHETFVTMDTNKDGVLGLPEYANLELVRKAGAAAPPMSAFDANKSQTLDFKEYLGFIRAMTKPRPKP